MTDDTLSRRSAAGKDPCGVHAVFPRTSCETPTRGRLPFPVPGVSPDEVLAVLSALELFGDELELGDLVSAIRWHPRPVAVILAMRDTGYLALDSAAPFDAHLRVYRVV